VDSLFGNNLHTVSFWDVPSDVFATPPVAAVRLFEEQARATAPVASGTLCPAAPARQ
jgi:glutathione reductase (NADPH)